MTIRNLDMITLVSFVRNISPSIGQLESITDPVFDIDSKMIYLSPFPKSVGRVNLEDMVRRITNFTPLTPPSSTFSFFFLAPSA